MAEIAWLIPRLIDGSGGHRTMMQHAQALEEKGHRCHLYIEGTGTASESPSEHVEKRFGYRFENVHFGWSDVRRTDLVVATVWYSAPVVANLPFPCQKIYFVQDLEACFFPMGDAFLLAENSYTHGLTPVTIGRWLRHELQTRFGTPGWHFDFGADTAVYRPLPDSNRERSVCFIYQPEKPRRCARLGLQALAIVKHRMPDVKIQLYGTREKPRVDFPVEFLGLLDYEACNALYNRAAVGLCLSSSNPSRIPFEMMAVGLPVIELWRRNTVHDFPDDAMRLCYQTPEAIAEGLLEVLGDPALAARMSEAGRTFMRDRGIAVETEQFCHAVERVFAGERATPLEDRERLYHAEPVIAGERVGVLPAGLRARLAEPPNARLNELPPHLRKFVAWGARTARRLLEYR